MGKPKKMCKWSKGDIQKDVETFKELVMSPTHACAKCGRVANSKKAVCKALDLNKG